jgi:acyl-CoA thioester hydrolase
MSSRSTPPDGVVRSTITVQSDWLDYNGHMNVAYYLVAFEQGIEDLKCTYGLDAEYRATQQRSTVALESHVTYQREAMEGQQLRIESQILATDGKRLHIAQAMYRDTTLLATQEILSISFDLAARKTCPFDPRLLSRINALIEARSATARPAWVGRTITLTASKPAT